MRWTHHECDRRMTPSQALPNESVRLRDPQHRPKENNHDGKSFRPEAR